MIVGTVFLNWLYEFTNSPDISTVSGAPREEVCPKKKEHFVRRSTQAKNGVTRARKMEWNKVSARRALSVS